MSATLDQRVMLVWLDAPHRRFGRCATCGCTHGENDQRLLVAGVNTDSLVCSPCFTTEHGGKLPNYRRRRPRQETPA